MYPRPKREEIKKYEKFLAPGEELAYVTRIGNKYYYSISISCILTFLMLCSLTPLSTYFGLYPLWLALPLTLSSVFCAFPLMKIMHLRHSLTYIFTNRRIIIKKGIMSITVNSAPYDKLTNIQVEQKMMDRMFYDTGSIILHTAGAQPVEMKLEKIEKPFGVKNLIDDLMHQEKQVTQKPAASPWPSTVMGEVMALE